MPRPKDFAKALFIVDIGQNDMAAGMRKLSIELHKAEVPKIVSQFNAQVQVS